MNDEQDPTKTIILQYLTNLHNAEEHLLRQKALQYDPRRSSTAIAPRSDRSRDGLGRHAAPIQFERRKPEGCSDARATSTKGDITIRSDIPLRANRITHMIRI